MSKKILKNKKTPKKKKKEPEKAQIGVLAPGNKAAGPPHQFANAKARDAFLSKMLKPRGNTVYPKNPKTRKI